MKHFSAFPKTLWDKTTITDVTIRLNFIQKIKNNAALFHYTRIRDGETPESLAYQVYGNSDLYWVILYMNDMVNTYEDWPRTSDQLYEYIMEKYGDDNINSVHHYETTEFSDLGEGIIVNQGTPFCAPVSNFQYENKLNDQKRKIKILREEYVSQVLKEYLRELQ